MQHPLRAIANEFDSYMQDRARRLGYSVRMAQADATCAPGGAARFALVEFANALSVAGRDVLTARDGMRALDDRAHFVAWCAEPGALVQVNVYRHEMRPGGGASGRVGVRAFAEAFFGDPQGRSLPRDAFTAYLDWLAAGTHGADANAAVLALAVRAPDTRELLLVRLPSVAAAHDWVRRNR